MEIVFGILVAIVVVIITYFKFAFNYWKKRNFPYVAGKIPFGSWHNPFTTSAAPAVIYKIFYDQFKNQEHKHGGIYLLASPRYMPVNPEYVKNILQNDFDYFMDRGIYTNEKLDPLSANLFAIEGHKWKKLRTKLTPTLTPGKIKLMFDTFIKCGTQMQEEIENFCENKKEIDIKNIVACFTTDVIGSCAFGIECNSFINPSAEFRKYGKKLFDPVSKTRALLIAFCTAMPELARTLRLKIVPSDCADFFLNAVKDTVKYRESNNIIRNDMLQMLIDLKNDSHSQDRLTIENIAAQAFVFFFAGFETSSTTMTFCLLELATDKDIQVKVRDELVQVLEKHRGEMTYEAMMEMKYLNQVVEETLRKYPPLAFLNRQCVKDYNIPGTDLVIEKGISVDISVLGLHRDPQYYPNPEKFDPERFSEANKQERQSFTYLPFGEGPRNCIGLKFGLMQTKVGLAVLLKNFEFSLNKKTKIPIDFDPFGYILASKGAIILNAEKVN